MPNKAYKFRLYPTPAQKVPLAKTFGCTRLVYNHFLDQKIKHYEKDKTTLSYNACSKELTEMKKTEEYEFLKEVDSIPLQQSLRHLDQAFQNFFNQPKKGFPKFKSKRNRKNSYSTVCVNQNITLSDGSLKLPKIGQVKIKQHREIPESYVLKSVTVSQSPSGKYYVSILFEYENQVPERRPQTFLGLDFSMHGLYKDSQGNEAEYPKYYRQAEKKLKREQRKLSHMEKGSKNREKQRIKVAKLHEKIANQRKDFLHKRSRSTNGILPARPAQYADIRTRKQKILAFGNGIARTAGAIMIGISMPRSI